MLIDINMQKALNESDAQEEDDLGIGEQK